MIAGATASESELEQFLARIPMPAFVVRGGRVVASNDRMCALLGRGRSEVLAAKGRAVKVSEDLWFASAALRDLRARLLAHLQQHGSIDAQGFKELTGQSRKFTIPLAEWFDKERVTLRVGDKRVLRKERDR